MQSQPETHGSGMNLREELELYKQMAEKSAIGIYVIEKATYRLLFANEAVKQFMADVDYHGRFCYEYLQGCKAQCSFCVPFGGKELGIPHEVYIPSSNRYFSVLSNNFDWRGTPAYIEYITDITAEVRRRAERERQYEEKSIMVARLLDGLPGGVAVFKFSNRLECLYFNEGIIKISGYSREEFEKLEQDGTLVEKTVYPPDLPYCLETIRRQKQHGKPLNLNYRFVKRDGSLQWLTMSAEKLREEDGWPVYYCVYTIPSCDAVLYRNIVDEAAVCVFAAERKSRRILCVNNRMRELYNFTDERKYVGKSLYDLVPADDMLLNKEEVEGLTRGRFTEFHKLYHDEKYLAVRAKALDWNGADSYIIYAADETNEYKRHLRQQELINLVPSGIGIYEINSGKVKLVYMNDSYYRIVGGEREKRMKAAESDFGYYMHPDDLPVLKAMVQNLVRGAGHEHGEYRVLCENGKYVWFRMDASVVRREGEKILVYCSHTDFTETISARQSLEKANAALQKQYEQERADRRQLEKDSAVIIQFNVTQDRLIAYSSVEKTLSDYRPGLTSAEIIPELLERVPVEKERDCVRRLLSKDNVMERFQKGDTEYTAEYRSRQKDGCLRWLRAVSRLRLDPSSGDVISYSFVRDIDREKKSELAVAGMVDEKTDFIVLISVVTNHVLLLHLGESCCFDGWHVGDVLDLDTFTSCEYMESTVDEDKHALSRIFDREPALKKLESEGACDVLYRIMTCDGRIRRKKASETFLDDMHEDVVVSSHDITDIYEEEHQQKRRLEKALEEAREASRAKSTFLSNMSHEIRTPMNAIIGMAELALSDTGDHAEMEMAMKSIRSSGSYMLSLINDILDMSRIENGKLTLEYEWISPLDLLMSCIDMVKPAIEAKHISFSMPEIKKIGAYEFRVDVLKTKRMLMNLLNNACKFTGEGGHIKLSFKSLCHGAETATDQISIEDDGCGMSKEFMKRIFTPFAQERNAYSGSIQGTGLGLALAREIARSMGGDITAESILGAGSKFTVTFPYRYRLNNHDEHKPSEQRKESLHCLQGVRILLCEDNKINSLIAEQLLEKAGCVVDCAENGKIGLQKFAMSKPSVYAAIIMDIRMPEMDGLETARAIRALERPDAETVPIIAMSANAFKEDVDKSMAAGMNVHLAKPVDTAKLYSVLAEEISKRVVPAGRS